MSKVINIVSNYHLTFEPLNNDKLIHLFTIKPFNFNDDLLDNDKILSEYKRIENIFNYKFSKIINPIQTHTSIVKCIDENNIDEVFQDVDGLITNLKDIEAYICPSILECCFEVGG